MSQIIRIRYVFYALAILATLLVSSHSFFWDTVQLGSKQAHFFFENGFGNFILPNEIDSGHPPFFGAYLALIWKKFGKTLVVSHFAMLPFLLGIIFFLLKIAEWLRPDHQPSWLVLFAFADPVLASQSILVSPDVVLVFFFLMCLVGILKSQKLLIILGATGLAMISTRGMMVSLALGLFSLPSVNAFPGWIQNSKIWIARLSLFMPAAIIGSGFLFYHYQQTGWIGYHELSIWAPSFERTKLSGTLKNAAILAWRFLDFGRVFIGLALGWMLITRFRKRSLNSVFDTKEKRLLLLIFFLGLCLIPPMLLHKGLSAHRYLLPFFLCTTFVFVKMLPTERYKWNTVAGLTLLGLLTGNFWVYPSNIAMGWDSTLAHLPWYSAQTEMIDELHQRNISLDQVGTAFPIIGPREMIDLNEEQSGFKAKDLNSDCYVLYSNVMNDFTDEEVGILQKDWEVLDEIKQGAVSFILFKNPAACEN